MRAQEGSARFWSTNLTAHGYHGFFSETKKTARALLLTFLWSHGWALSGIISALVCLRNPFGHFVDQQPDQLWDIRSGERWLLLGVYGLAF